MTLANEITQNIIINDEYYCLFISVMIHYSHMAREGVSHTDQSECSYSLSYMGNMTQQCTIKSNRLSISCLAVLSTPPGTNERTQIRDRVKTSMSVKKR